MDKITSLLKKILICKCKSQCCNKYEETHINNDTHKIDKIKINKFCFISFNNKRNNSTPDTPDIPDFTNKKP